MIEQSYKVISKKGIQARPAAQLVNLSSQFDSDISINYQSSTANLKSIMGVMSLAIKEKAIVTISANGSDEQEAMQQIDFFLQSETAERQ